MRTRQTRYRNITGTENDVEQHELHIDQMRIDLAAGDDHPLRPSRASAGPATRKP